jgi:hypothetical protein
VARFFSSRGGCKVGRFAYKQLAIARLTKMAA